MTLDKFSPLNENVLVQVATEEEVTKGGIIMSAANHERKYEGTIIKVGTHPDIEKMGIKPGQYVFYPKGLNIEVIIDKVVYDVVKVYDLLAAGE